MEIEGFEINALDEEEMMDTVIEVTDIKSGITREYRYDGKSSAPYRDPDSGVLDLETFVDEVVVWDINCDTWMTPEESDETYGCRINW